jgi:hypothetical protein
MYTVPFILSLFSLHIGLIKISSTLACHNIIPHMIPLWHMPYTCLHLAIDLVAHDTQVGLECTEWFGLGCTSCTIWPYLAQNTYWTPNIIALTSIELLKTKKNKGIGYLKKNARSLDDISNLW